MKHASLISTFALLAVCRAASALEPASHFSDGAVLQRDAAVLVWGTSKPGATVKVSFAGQTVAGRCGDDGNWTVSLKPMAASAENREMVIMGDSRSVTVRDVLVGEVWVGSGQSNMAGRVASYAKRDASLAALVAKAPFPDIRLMQGGPKPVWKSADAASVNSFSALLFPFGERLHRELGVPVGLIVGAVGGTPSGMWMPATTFESSDRCKSEIAAFTRTWNRERAQKQYEAKLAAWEKAVAKAKAEGKKARGRKPRPPAEPGASTRGGAIGGLYARYIASSAGYAIRGVLWDQGEAGSGIQGLGQYTSMSELIRGWREAWGQGDFPFLFVQKPSGLGVAWSKDDPITRESDTFAALPDIKRAGSGQGRYLYTRLMLDNRDAWMVPACDLGSMIHPINKWGYGNRAAQVALQKVYRKKGVQAYGPIYDSHEIRGGEVHVRFRETGRGLVTRHGDELQGFAVAGSDGVWHWAKAEIVSGDTVVVSCAAVKSPTQARFAYAQNRQWANLYNKNGLPALAFTTEAIDFGRP